MAEYINRGDLIRLFEAKADMATGTHAMVFHDVCKIIALLPADDVEEVTRCKDCKHYYVWSTPGRTFTECTMCECDHRNPDDYCSLGERKE